MKGSDGKTEHATGIHGSIGHGTRTPVILYVDCRPDAGIEGMRLAGLRRYAAARKWRVETLEHKNCSPAALREALAKFRPIGCAVECWCPETALRPSLFGRVPVVYFEPPDDTAWRNVRGVSCDNAAVAKMAFKELSSTCPPAYAAVSFSRDTRYSRERIDAFVECCREAGFNCPVSVFPSTSREELARRRALMAQWAAALPHRCAVFAANDICARRVARAMSDSGRSFPRTVTFVGADGTEPPECDRDFADMASTVRIDHELAGYLAAKMIGKLFSHGDTESLVFPPLLVDRRKSTRGYGRREPRILEAMEMIRREACDGLTAEKLAKRFRGSRQHFALRFKEAAGHTILDEILNVRIARATELLANTDMPIGAVADFCGFQSGWEFWDIFRKKVGMPPLRFRRFKRD